MRSLLLASSFATLGLADLAWIDLRLAPDIVERETVADAPAVPPRPDRRTLERQAPLAMPTSPAPPPPRSPRPPLPTPPRLVLQYGVDEREPADTAKRDEDAAFALLSADPSLVVIIDGHTDRTGWTVYNERLSRARADAIAAALVARGVPRSRISVSGHGARRPIAQGDDPGSLARNRRVELSFERRTP
jgi:outer membrane protein OmpA-like peptidoglycan-associated protein